MSTEVIPQDLAELLSELRRRRWTLFRWGPEDAPELVAAVYRWETCCDVFVLRDKDDASAYRCPLWSVFNPQAVWFQSHGDAQSVLREILDTSDPWTDGAMVQLEIAGSGCQIPDALPKPVIIRPL